MRTFQRIFFLFAAFIATTVFAGTPSKNTLVIQPLTTYFNLHWQGDKEILIIVAPAPATENDLIPKNNIAYSANTKYGEGTSVSNGFVVYKGKANAVTVTGLQNNQTYFIKSFIADVSGDFTIAGPPMTSFICVSLGYRAQMTWRSSDDISGDKITVERENGNGTWMEISDAGKLPLTAKFPGTNFYDKGRLDGNYSYRVKHVYADGNVVISEPIGIRSFYLDGVFSVSPQDAHEGKKYFILADHETELTVTNSKGEVVIKTQLKENTAYSFILQNVPSGIYNIQGSNKNGSHTTKVTVQ